jgi:hypothetical protein
VTHLAFQDRNLVFEFVFDFFTEMRIIFKPKSMFLASQPLLNLNSRLIVADLSGSQCHRVLMMRNLIALRELYQPGFHPGPEPSFEVANFRSSHCFR